MADWLKARRKRLERALDLELGWRVWISMWNENNGARKWRQAVVARRAEEKR